MSQGSANIPTTGPDAPTNFANQINTALTALFSKNSGASAPTNFPTTGTGATQGQDWLDTSPGGGIIDLRLYDGTSWLYRGAFDTTNHVSMPKVGGGSGSITGAGGGTVDLGSIRQTYIKLNSTTAGSPITSFGNNASLQTGETRFVEATAVGQITHNGTSLILPGATDLNFNIGDTWQMVYLGGGNWRMFDYMRASGLGIPTGATFTMHGTGTFPGAVRLNARTIGNGGSGATERANADTANLWIYLYLQDVNLTVSGGRSGSTRATAITDYNANKTITLPDDRFRAEFGLDDMGNSAAGRSTGATFSSGTATTLGAVGGEAAHTLIANELPLHTHTLTLHRLQNATPSPGVAGSGNANYYLATGSVGDQTSDTLSTANNTSTVTAHNTMAPFQLRTRYIAL